MSIGSSRSSICGLRDISVGSDGDGVEIACRSYGGTVGISELLRIANTLFTDNSDARLRQTNPPGNDKALLPHHTDLENAVTEVTPFQISSGHSSGVSLCCTGTSIR
jgi:hypothetical protein